MSHSAITVALCALLCACHAHRSAPRPAASSKPLAVSAVLDLEPLDLSPDGEARLLVRLHYRDAGGERAHVPPGGHVDVFTSRGSVQWQPRAQYGDPAAIVRLTEAGPLELRVSSDLPHVPQQMRASTDTRNWHLPAVTARALGPHVVCVGWFPRVHSGVVRIERSDARNGKRRMIANVRAPASTFRDTSVTPGAHYTYEIARPRGDRIDVGVDMPRELPASGVNVIRGKAMWLSFDDVTHWDVGAMLARAQSAGIRAIELRMTYGEYAQITPLRKATIDRFIDDAAQDRIAVLAWTVPRALTYEDLAVSVAGAAYVTPKGNRIRGLAVDLERGADFLAGERSVLADYVIRLREAVGPHVLLVATVEDPYLEGLTERDIPYAAIAAAADVLQPMTYWRIRPAGASVDGMRAELAGSYQLLSRFAARAIPIDIGGQTANLGNHSGAPSPAEVAASIAVARDLGAIGETFFDWDATSADQWTAIARSAWP